MNRKMARDEALPKGWREVKLGEICTIRRGGSPRPIQDYLTTSEQGINWLRIGDVAPQSKYIFKTKEKIKPEGLKKSVLVKEGDFILSNSMSYGRPYIMRVRSCIHDGWLTLSNISKTVHKEYLYYVLLTNKIQNTFKSISAGSGVQNLKKESVFSIQITLPPLLKQKAIASLLETWDTAIEKTEALIATKEKRFKWSLKRLISDQQDNSGWRKVRLGEIAEMSSGGTPKSTTSKYYGGDIPWVSIADMTASGKYIDETKKKLSKLGLENGAGKVFPAGTIFYAMYASIGVCAISKIPAATSQAILGIQTRNNILPHFLYYWFISIKDRTKLQGQHGIQPNLNARIVKSFRVSVPFLSEQEKITALLNTIQHEIDLLQKLAEQYRTQKFELTQKLLTGKWRVKR